MRTFAISDIHGCLKTFQALLEEIQFSKADHLVLLGDYIDRGINSKGVIDHIWNLQAQGYQIDCLKGNHEQMLLDGLVDPDKERFWAKYGGKQTMESFGASSVSDIPKKYIYWLENLPHFLEKASYIFVHAGLNFDMPNPIEGQQSMLWIRGWYQNINYHWLQDRIIVHGHTPIPKAEMEVRFKKLTQTQVLDIDAGCVFGKPKFGDLCAFDLINQQLFFQEKVD